MEEKVMTEMDTVLQVIKAINNKFPEVMKKVCPTNPHRDPVNYYLTGSCVQYAEILHEVFKGYAKLCCTKGHAFVHIGDHYYDASGICFTAEYKEEEFEEFSFEDEPYFYMSTLPFGRWDKQYDQLLENEFINIGKEALGKIIEQKLQEKNTLS